MIILGIETSSAVCSVGLADEKNLVIERSIIESHIHSEKLLTLIHEICKNQKLLLSQIDAVAISIGPGSFTGLRIGLSTAKGLCFAIEKPLIAVSSFIAVAACAFLAHPEYKQVAICIDAKQGEYYIGVYEKDGEKIEVVLPVNVRELDTFCATISDDAILLTDKVEQVKKTFRDNRLVEEVLPYFKGDIIASVGIDKLKQKEISKIDNLEPMYLKDFIVRKPIELKK